MIRLAVFFVLWLVAQATSAFSVSITTTLEGGDKPTVIGKTNLPNGTELMVTLSRKESSYMAQDKAVVSNGQFRAGPFSQKGTPLNPGVYQIEVSSPLAALQPQSVRAVIGQDGGKLEGPLAKKSQFGGKVVEYRSTTKIGTASASAQKDQVAREEAKKDRHDWWIQSCKDNCNLVSRYAAQRNEAFNWDKCYQKCLAEEPKK
jgi:hypothetical protein